MKARFKIKNSKVEICSDYPNCICEGHFVYEKHNEQ